MARQVGLHLQMPYGIMVNTKLGQLDPCIKLILAFTVFLISLSNVHLIYQVMGGNIMIMDGDMHTQMKLVLSAKVKFFDMGWMEQRHITKNAFNCVPLIFWPIPLGDLNFILFLHFQPFCILEPQVMDCSKDIDACNNNINGLTKCVNGLCAGK